MDPFLAFVIESVFRLRLSPLFRMLLYGKCLIYSVRILDVRFLLHFYIFGPLNALKLETVSIFFLILLFHSLTVQPPKP